MWVWVIIGLILVYDFVTKNPRLVHDLLLFAPILLGLYLFQQLTAKWLDRRKKERPQREAARQAKQAEQAAQQRQQQLEQQRTALAQEWHDAPPLPTTDEIAQAIVREVGHDHFLAPLLARQAAKIQINAEMRPAQAVAEYQNYVKASVLAIREYDWLRPMQSVPPESFPYHYTYTADEQHNLCLKVAAMLKAQLPGWRAYPPLPLGPASYEYLDKNGDVVDSKWHAAFARHDKEVQKIFDELPPQELALINTPLFEHSHLLPTTELRAISFSPTRRYEGTWIIAPPGRGKTNLLWQLVDRDLQTDEKTIILMDSKGTFIKEFRDYPGAVVLTKDNIRVNPFSFGTDVLSVEFAEYLLSTLVNVEMTQLQRTMFSSVVEVLLHVPNATLETFHDILSEGIANYQAAVEKCNPITKAFFLKGKVPDWNNEQSQRTKGEVRARLRTLLRYEYMRTIFLAKRNSHDFLGLLSSRRLIIIDNSKDDLGEQGSEFLGRFFIALIRMEGVKRTKLKRSERVPIYLYIDEAQNVIATDRKLRSIIQECRDQNIALTIAHQYIDDISTEVRPALYNCAVRIANADEEAPEIAPRLNATVEEVKLPAHNFCVYVRDATPKAVRIHVDFLDLDAIPKGPPYIPPTPEEPEPHEDCYEPEPETLPHSTTRTKDDF